MDGNMRVYCRECECADALIGSTASCKRKSPNFVSCKGTSLAGYWPVINIETDFCFEGVRKRIISNDKEDIIKFIYSL